MAQSVKEKAMGQWSSILVDTKQANLDQIVKSKKYNHKWPSIDCKHHFDDRAADAAAGKRVSN